MRLWVTQGSPRGRGGSKGRAPWQSRPRGRPGEQRSGPHEAGFAPARTPAPPAVASPAQKHTRRLQLGGAPGAGRGGAEERTCALASSPCARRLRAMRSSASVARASCASAAPARPSAVSARARAAPASSARAAARPPASAAAAAASRAVASAASMRARSVSSARCAAPARSPAASACVRASSSSAPRARASSCASRPARRQPSPRRPAAPRLPPPPPRTKWTRRVPHPVLIGHAASPHPVLYMTGLIHAHGAATLCADKRGDAATTEEGGAAPWRRGPRRPAAHFLCATATSRAPALWPPPARACGGAQPGAPDEASAAGHGGGGGSCLSRLPAPPPWAAL